MDEPGRRGRRSPKARRSAGRGRRKPPIGIDLLTELLDASAANAAAAFEQFADRALAAAPHALRPAGAPLRSRIWSMGVFFEAAGDLSAHIALLLTRETCDAVAELGGRTPPGAPPGGAFRSMLLELGNIVASQTVSAIADAQRGRILLSIPSLVAGGVERELLWRARRLGPGAPGLRIECEFEDDRGGRQALLVLIPEVAADAP